MIHFPALPNPELSENISHLLYTIVITAHKKQPQLLTESCRHWLQTTSPESQTTKIKALLEQQSDVSSLLNAVVHILEKLFIVAFKNSSAYGQVLQKVQDLITAKTSQPDTLPTGEVDSTEDNPVNGGNGEAVDPNWAGLLLVDAENMNPPKALEEFLQVIGQYPIRYRLAFGNWRKLGGRDQELYQRGYHMVHVPSGKNSADIKMSLDASLISLWNPSIREVFICSADTDLLHLGHVLLNLGITPYRVSRHHDRFDILNIARQTTQVFHLSQADSGDERGLTTVIDPVTESVSFSGSEPVANPVAHKIPNLNQMKCWLKALILQEQEANPRQPITINHLGKLFLERNQISANQILKSNSNYKTLKQFLEAHEIFELSPLPDGQHFEVTIKPAANKPIASIQNAQQDPTNKAHPKIVDIHSLEQALIKTMWSLSSNQSGGQITLSMLGSQFAQIHEEPLSQVLKRLGEPKGLPKFLAKCRSLRTHKQGKEWQVALACVS